MSGYIALVHKDEGTSYGVSFPDVPGCISAGDTFEKAVANAADALAAHFAVMNANGEVIPTPRDFHELKRDPQFVEDAADAVVTEVTPSEKPFHPAYGLMKGLVRVMPGTDLSQPADPDWADYLDAKYGPEKKREV